MKSVQTYLGGGATGALVGAAFFFLVSLTAVVSFSDWPPGLSGPSRSVLDIGGIAAPSDGETARPDSESAVGSGAGAATVRLGGPPRASGTDGVSSSGSAAARPGGGGAAVLTSETGRGPASGGPRQGGGGGGPRGGSASAPGILPNVAQPTTPVPGTPPGQTEAPQDESEGAPSSVPTAGNSGKVPPGQAKKAAAAVAVPESAVPTAGNSGKIPPGQAKKAG
jgi:hypothetical protein